jgi:hypothetical protein
VDGAGNLYIADDADNAIKEWNVTTGLLRPLVSEGQDSRFGNIAVDAAGNVNFADSQRDAIKTLTRAFVPGDSVSEGPAAGSDHLLPVPPTSLPLTDPFAPQSDQPWLTFDASADGVVHFSFAANTGPARTAHLTVTDVCRGPLQVHGQRGREWEPLRRALKRADDRFHVRTAPESLWRRRQ